MHFTHGVSRLVVALALASLPLLAGEALAKSQPRAVTLQEAMLDPGEEPTLDEFEQAFFKVFNTTSTQSIMGLIKSWPKFAPMLSENEWGIETPELLTLLQYTGSGYMNLNRVLRVGSKDPMTEEARILAWYLFKGLKKLPISKKTTYRAAHLTPKLLKAYQVGNYVQPQGFTSTSEEPGVAHNFYDKTRKGSVLFKFNGVSGRVLGPLTYCHGEEEVLFPPGAVFKVVRRKEGKFDWKVMGPSGKRHVTRQVEGIMIELDEVSAHDRIDDPILKVEVDAPAREERAIDRDLASSVLKSNPQRNLLYSRWQHEADLGLLLIESQKR